MTAGKIMYVCEPCHENAPEGCGYCNRDDLRMVQLAKGPAWMCRDCLDNAERNDFADGVIPSWGDLSAPPEYSPLGDQLLAFHEAWAAHEVASATGNPKLARETRGNMLLIHNSIRASE